MLRRPDSIPAGDTVIKDPAMEPFFIAKSQTGGYTVYEDVIKGANNTRYIKTICYPSTFSRALKVVAGEQLNSGTKKMYSSVKEYIIDWEKIQEKMSVMTTITV